MDDYVTKPIQIDQIVQILTHWTTESFKKIPVLERANVIDALDPNILDWQQSLQLAANKEDLAVDLLSMLVDSFEKELDEIEQLIELEDFPQLETCFAPSLWGYSLCRHTDSAKVTGSFEQFVSTLRMNAVRPMTVCSGSIEISG